VLALVASLELEDPVDFLVVPVASLELAGLRHRLRPAADVEAFASRRSTKQ
jgi:hypothetical protein